MFNWSTWIKEEREGESRGIIERRFIKYWKNKDLKASKFNEKYKSTAVKVSINPK